MIIETQVDVSCKKGGAMNRAITTMAIGIATLGSMSALPANAQYMMHLDPNLYMLATMNMGGGVDPCMTGTPRSLKKIAEARSAAPSALQAYFKAAQSGAPKSAAFHLDKATKWRSGTTLATAADLNLQVDPLALAGHVLDAEPVRFYRGGAGATALGQWAVLDAQGQVAGAYTALFVGVERQWKLRDLTISQATEALEPAAQYCRKPSDVMTHRLESTKRWREGAAKNVEEAKAELAKASAGYEKAKAAFAAKPRDATARLASEDAQRKLTRWTKQLEQREKNLAQALEKSAEAQKDADELKRLTGEVRTIHAFKVVEVPKETVATK